MRIVFVCTGNTCRSPMAEGLAGKIWGPDIQVESAGLAAWEGEPAAAQAVQVLQEKGIDLMSHQARLVRREILAAADWIIPMTAAHEMQLKGAFPEFAPKIKRLGHWAGDGKDQDIPDPWGGSVEQYRRCAEDMEALLHKVKASLEGRH